MDYAFAPGGTKFDKLVAKYLSLRPQTTLLTPATLNVAAFVSMINTDASVQRPVGTLSIGCHGHSYGLLEIFLDSTSAGKYSDINDVLRTETSHALELTTAALFPRPIDPITLVPSLPIFRIVGCSVGAARKFLEHLRKALGNVVNVVATPHEDGQLAFTVVSGSKVADGVLRLLTYDFRVNTPIVLEGQEDVVEAFDKKHLTFIDGKPIPRSFWKERVPSDPFGTTRVEKPVNLMFNPKINGSPSLQPNLKCFEFKWEPVGPWKVAKPTGPVQTTTQRREFMRGQIKNKPEFATSHPFPLYEQRGFTSFDAFMDGHDWLESPKLEGFWTGYRCVYSVGAPITIPSDSDELPYDWVDTTNTSTHFGLSEFDNRLFVMIP